VLDGMIASSGNFSLNADFYMRLPWWADRLWYCDPAKAIYCSLCWLLSDVAHATRNIWAARVGGGGDAGISNFHVHNSGKSSKALQALPSLHLHRKQSSRPSNSTP
jgi:hypothetical protein